MKIKSDTELTVGQKAHALTLRVYRLTEKFPRSEQFGVTSQLRRSAASVAANIAEGFGRGTTKELLHALRVARGELEETRYFIMLSRDWGHVSQVEFDQMSEDCNVFRRLVHALGRSLKGRLNTSH